jgi:L-malate glycosyltransferase
MPTLGFISLMNGSAWGGSEELWSQCALAATRNGHRVVAEVRRRIAASDRLNPLRSAGASISAIALPDQYGFTNRIRNRLPSYVPFANVLAARPNAVLVSMGGAFDWQGIPGYGRFLEQARAANIAVHYLIHSNYDNIHLPQVARQRVAEVYGRAASVGFPAGHYLRITERQALAKFPTGYVFASPINPTCTAPLPWPAEDTLRLAFVARLDMYKGVDILLATFCSPQWADRPFELSIYGDGPQEEYFHGLHRHFGASPKVVFRGPTADIRSVWQGHHALVLPSRVEGLPLVLLEAAICGRPSIITDVGGVRDWTMDREVAFLAEGATEHSFARTAEAAWRLRDKWRAMGAAAAQRAAEHLTPAPELVLLERLLNAGQPPA